MNLVIPCHSNNYCTYLHIATAARSVMKLLIHATSKTASVFSDEFTINVKNLRYPKPTMDGSRKPILSHFLENYEHSQW